MTWWRVWKYPHPDLRRSIFGCASSDPGNGGKQALSALWTREKLRRAPRLRERRGGKREPVDRNRLRVAAATSRPRRSGDLTRPWEDSVLFAAGWTSTATRDRETAHPGRPSLGSLPWTATGLGLLREDGTRGSQETAQPARSRRAPCSRVFGPGGGKTGSPDACYRRLYRRSHRHGPALSRRPSRVDAAETGRGTRQTVHARPGPAHSAA